MKKSRVVLFVFMVVTAFLVSCASWKTIARTVIDAGLAACMMSHPDIVDEAELHKVCDYAEDVAPIVRDLLSARKQGLARRAALSDGGSNNGP